MTLFKPICKHGKELGSNCSKCWDKAQEERQKEEKWIELARADNPHRCCSCDCWTYKNMKYGSCHADVELPLPLQYKEKLLNIIAEMDEFRDPVQWDDGKYCPYYKEIKDE